MDRNAILLKQREDAVLRFISITCAGREDAVGIMKRYAYDVEEAVDAYLGGERCPVSEAEAAPPASADAAGSEPVPPAEPAEPPRPASQVDRILNSVEKVDRSDPRPAPLFGGAGNSLSASNNSNADQRLLASDPDPIDVNVTFYGNGFTVVDGPDQSARRSSASGGATSATSRSGLATLSDFGSARSNQDEFTGTAVLRPMDDAVGREFMRDIENSTVPREVRRIDPRSGRPVPVNITLHDRRPKNYRHVPDTSFKAFSGSGGQALGAASTDYTALPDGGVTGAFGFLDFLRGLRTCPRRLLGLGPRPPRRPAVRSDVPQTKLQIRMGSGQRVQVVLNNAAPISDLFLAVECEMYEQWQAEGCPGGPTWTCPAFDLVAGYPPQHLSADRSVTLEAHSPVLIGAAVTQRIRPPAA